VSMYRIAAEVEDRVTAKLAVHRQAQKEVEACCGMGFDSSDAAGCYRAGLEHLGVDRRELGGLTASELGAVFRNVGARRARRSSLAGMAYDAASPELDAILAGVPMPVNMSTR
jgi:hypothetical protein